MGKLHVDLNNSTVTPIRLTVVGFENEPTYDAVISDKGIEIGHRSGMCRPPNYFVLTWEQLHNLASLVDSITREVLQKQSTKK